MLENKKIVQLNSALSGSPGTLMRTISESLSQQQIENEMLVTYGSAEAERVFKYGTDFGVKINALKSRITGRYGFCSEEFTKKLIEHLEEYKPDLIQIHTIHGHDLHFQRFFAYAAERNIPVVYTMHDCWAFTGYCPYYDSVNCEKWKTLCENCALVRNYSWFKDCSTENMTDKKNALSALSQLHVITPSKWMARQVEQSFLSERPCTVIPNGIDTNIFCPRVSGLKQKLKIENKKMVLGVAMSISEGKGKQDFIELSRKLPEEYQIVLVGVDPKDKIFPDNIICVPRTSSKAELAEYYSAADVFLNPTHYDNFPTVNLEALACGTPIVTYEVGGAYEAIDSLTGKAVPFQDLEALCAALIEVADHKEAYSQECRLKAEREYSKTVFADRYLNIYRTILND